MGYYANKFWNCANKFDHCANKFDNCANKLIFMGNLPHWESIISANSMTIELY